MGLAKLTNLTEVDLSCTRCDQILAVDELGKGVAELTNLKVDLSSTRCNQIDAVDEPCKGLAWLTNLTQVDMSFTRYQITWTSSTKA